MRNVIMWKDAIEHPASDFVPIGESKKLLILLEGKDEAREAVFFNRTKELDDAEIHQSENFKVDDDGIEEGWLYVLETFGALSVIGQVTHYAEMPKRKEK